MPIDARHDELSMRPREIYANSLRITIWRGGFVVMLNPRALSRQQTPTARAARRSMQNELGGGGFLRRGSPTSPAAYSAAARWMKFVVCVRVASYWVARTRMMLLRSQTVISMWSRDSHAACN